MKAKLVLLCYAALISAIFACSGNNTNRKKINNNYQDQRAITDSSKITDNIKISDKMNITIGDKVLTATLADNSSVDALKAELAKGPVTVSMRDYGNMEKVGALGFSLPRNDKQTTTEAGDIILYQGNALVIYYAPNSWSFTRLGKIDKLNALELKDVLGKGNVTVTLSLP